MIRRYLDNYKTFNCIAADCPDTCCSGWLIEIDEKSLDRFEKVSKKDADFGNRVNFSDSCFFQAPNKDCDFLLESGLCKMQKEYGEDMLCYTCDMYPRHVEEFPNVREYSLSASCPVVAKALTEKKEYISFCQTVDEEPDPDSIDEYEDYNDLLYDKLLVIRDRIIAVLCGDGAFDDKARIILDAMRDVQEDLDLGLYDGIEEAFNDVGAKKKLFGEFYIEVYFEDLNKMKRLEPLQEDFVAWMKKSEEFMRTKYAEDTDWFIEKYRQFEIENAQIDLIQCDVALYFIFTYFCGAVYDNYVYSAVRLAIFASRVIKMLSFVNWLETGKGNIDRIIYKFCRELEHSNDNLNMIKKELDLQ